MNPWPLLATAGLAFGAGSFARAFGRFRVRRLMQDTPTARMRSMPMGLVEIAGDVSGRSDEHAPFSDRPCVYWEVEVSIQGGRRGGWRTVHREQSGRPFYVSDGTGTVLVYPRGAECRVLHGLEEMCHGLALPSVYADWMAKHRLAWRWLWRIGGMRFRERMLTEGQHVYVLGHASPRAQSLAISDGEAMQATGTDGLRAIRVQSLDAVVQGVIRREPAGQVFVISEQSERQLTFELGGQIVLGLVAGPILFLLGLAYWLSSANAGRLLE